MGINRAVDVETVKIVVPPLVARLKLGAKIKVLLRENGTTKTETCSVNELAEGHVVFHLAGLTYENLIVQARQALQQKNQLAKVDRALNTWRQPLAEKIGRYGARRVNDDLRKVFTVARCKGQAGTFNAPDWLLETKLGPIGEKRQFNEVCRYLGIENNQTIKRGWDATTRIKNEAREHSRILKTRSLQLALLNHPNAADLTQLTCGNDENHGTRFRPWFLTVLEVATKTEKVAKPKVGLDNMHAYATFDPDSDW